MKRWILPAAAVGAAVFLMTRRGRRLRERVTESVGDWGEMVLHSSQRVQDLLGDLQAGVSRFNQVLEKVSNQ